MQKYSVTMTAPHVILESVFEVAADSETAAIARAQMIASRLSYVPPDAFWRAIELVPTEAAATLTPVAIHTSKKE